MTSYLTINCKICFLSFQKVLTVETPLKAILRDNNKIFNPLQINELLVADYQFSRQSAI